MSRCLACNQEGCGRQEYCGCSCHGADVGDIGLFFSPLSPPVKLTEKAQQDMERRVTHHNDTRTPTHRVLIREDVKIRSIAWIFNGNSDDYAVLVEQADEDSLGNKRWSEIGRYYHPASAGRAGDKLTSEQATARLLRGDIR